MTPKQAADIFVESWLFSQEPDWETLTLRGKLLGIDIHIPYLVVLLDGVKEEPGEERKPYACSGRHYCVRFQDKLLLLLPCDCRQQAGGILHEIGSEPGGGPSRPICGGASVSNGRPEDIRRCYREAKLACRAAQKLGLGEILVYDEVSLDFVVESMPGDMRETLRDRIFGRCSEAEKREFMELVQVFFQEEGNLNRCADRLFVHRNTVQYRLDRVRKKTGYDLRRPRDACLLYIGSL